MWQYSDQVKEHLYRPRNVGVLEQANGVGEVGVVAYGDALRLMIRVDEGTSTIMAARFQTFGCGSAIASSSALTEMIVGKTVDEALTINNRDIAEFLGGLPPEKMHGSVMGYEALRAAVADYRGKASQQDHEQRTLVCKCFGVDEGMIERTVRVNALTTLEQVTQFTNAGGRCAACAGTIKAVLARTQAAMAMQRSSPPSAVKPDAGAVVSTETPAPAQRAIPAAAGNGAGSAATSVPTSPADLQRLREIEQAIEALRPSLRADGGDCQLVAVDGDRVTIRLSGACVGCQMASVTIGGVQRRLSERLGRPLRVIPV